ELIVNNAHPLKSSSGGIGAIGLYEAARTVEIETKKQQNTKTAENLIGEIKQLFSIYSEKLKAAG
ncbi:MAG: hypothetical protein MK137_02490, partial [Rickettsiales bacterium]|nr:hypothetical protein [Rickettsiales bacterium]